MYKRIFAGILAVLLLVAGSIARNTQAQRNHNVYLPNDPDRICLMLTRNVYADFTVNDSKTWDFDASYKFLQWLLGKENPHLAQLSPTIMVTARRMQVKLLELGEAGSADAIIYESWDDCVTSLTRRLYSKAHYTYGI